MVVGSKAVEAAYQEGKWPVVDKTVDVYALQCSSGMTSVYHVRSCELLMLCRCEATDILHGYH